MKQLPYIQTSTAIIGYTESTIAKSEKNDCFVRAVASSFDMPYDDAHSWVADKFKRENRKGTRYVASKMRLMSENKENLNGKSVKTIDGLNVINIIEGKVKRTTLNQFIKKYHTGTYVMLVRGHAFTLKNGSVIGNTKDSKSIRKIITDAFEVC